jgi:hypothetical protein
MIHSDSFFDDVIKEGIIQQFEYTHELARYVVEGFLNYSGTENVMGPRDAIRPANESGLLQNAEV